MARRERRRRRLDHRRVAEQRVAIAGDERRRHDAAAARAHDRGALDGIRPVLLGCQPARGVDLRPRDVRVDVDAARHHDHAARVDPRRVVGHVLDDLAVAQADVAHLAGHAVGRVVDAPAGDAERHASRPAIACEHVLVARPRRLEQRTQRDRHAVEPVHDAGPVHPGRGGRERDARRVGRRRAAGVDRHDGDRAQAVGGAAAADARADRSRRRAPRRRRRARARPPRSARPGSSAGARPRSSRPTGTRSARRARPRRRRRSPRGGASRRRRA